MPDDLREAAQALLTAIEEEIVLSSACPICESTTGHLDRCPLIPFRAALAADSTPVAEHVDDRWAPVRRAIDSDWVDDMRQTVERRLGVPAADPAVLDDPAYQAVLDADRALETARDMIAAAIAWCPVGGLCPPLSKPGR